MPVSGFRVLFFFLISKTLMHFGQVKAWAGCCTGFCKQPALFRYNHTNPIGLKEKDEIIRILLRNQPRWILKKNQVIRICFSPRSSEWSKMQKKCQHFYRETSERAILFLEALQKEKTNCCIGRLVQQEKTKLFAR